MQLKMRVGDINYLNTYPLRWGLSQMKIPEVFLGTPAEVNQALLKGEIDLGPVSSIFYLKNREKFVGLGNICIASSGEVKSVILISRFPLKKLDGKSISLTRASATSQKLLQIILGKKGLVPQYVLGEKDLLEKGEVDASLLIGDDALKAYIDYLEGKTPFYLYDLGKEWKELTGKPMVFAFWVVRKEIFYAQPQVVNESLKDLLSALRLGLSNLDKVVSEAARLSGIEENFLKGYYQGLTYYLGEEQKQGLTTFYELAIKGKPLIIEFLTSPFYLEKCKV